MSIILEQAEIRPTNVSPSDLADEPEKPKEVLMSSKMEKKHSLGGDNVRSLPKSKSKNSKQYRSRSNKKQHRSFKSLVPQNELHKSQSHRNYNAFLQERTIHLPLLARYQVPIVPLTPLSRKKSSQKAAENLSRAFI